MALDFDGVSQYIQVAQTKDLPIYNEVTYSICGWVKAPAQDDKRIFAEGSSASNRPLLTIGSGGTSDEADDKIHMYIRNDANAALLHVFSTTTFFDNTWHNFCWVDNNGDADLYIDGTLDATSCDYTRSGTFAMNRTGIAAIIRAAVSHWLDGELFDIRCYNRCLTPNEISEIYTKRGADKIWQGLVGWWRLDEFPSGTLAPLLLDSMDSTSGWIATGGAVSQNTTTYQEGSGALNFTKTATNTVEMYAQKSISSLNIINQDIKIYAYIKDSATLAKIDNVNMMIFAPNVLNRASYYFRDLSVGWNELSANINDFGKTGSPNFTNVQMIRAGVYSVNNVDTWSAGDAILDFYRAGNYTPNSIIDLSGNGNHGTPVGGPIYQASPHRLRRGVLIS